MFAGRVALGILGLAIALVSPGGASAQRLQSTDIFLAPLSFRNGAPVIGTPINITSRAAWRVPGYDTEPIFSPDGKAVLFVSKRGANRSWIYRYDIASKASTRLTDSTVDEFTPSIMPGGTRYSAIRVEPAVVRIGRRRLDPPVTQRLWSFALDGSDPRLLLDSVRPVGSYAWLGANDLIVSIIGMPEALVHADTRSVKTDTLALATVRALTPMPNRSGVSFLRRVDTLTLVSTIRWPSGTARDVVALPRGSGAAAWLNGELLLVSTGAKLSTWQTRTRTWAQVSDLESAGMVHIVGMSVSPDERWVAFTVMPRICPAESKTTFEVFTGTSHDSPFTKADRVPRSCVLSDGR